MESSNQREVPGIVHENIRELWAHRKKHEQKLSRSERIANRIAHFTGTTFFIYLNAAFFALWILLNLGLFGAKPFDPFPFGMLTTVVSLEAIFLSLFVLLSQNRMQELSDRQNELDLQVNLLAERELTHMLQTIDLIADKLGVDLPHAERKAELESETQVGAVLKEIEAKNED
ncbi:MAG: DUF1003 domain-containing protein [Armatimonadota bacterium]|nr:DUF1003 domain-containing protein [Armatimonadota bacterium]